MPLNLDSISDRYKKYLKWVDSDDVLQTLRESGLLVQELVRGISDDKVNFRYEPNKWTIGEVVQHLLDTERVFAYRALLFARGENTISHSFDPDMFAKNANPFAGSLSEMADKLMRLRATTLDFFADLSPLVLQRRVVLNANEMPVEFLGFLIAGHETHHRHILEEKYLK